MRMPICLQVDDIMRSSDNNSDRLISFDEFLPWYRRMAEKHWRATHGGKTIVKEERPAPAPVPTPAPAPARTKLAAAAPPAAKPSAPKLPSPPKASLPSGRRFRLGRTSPYRLTRRCRMCTQVVRCMHGSHLSRKPLKRAALCCSCRSRAR